MADLVSTVMDWRSLTVDAVAFTYGLFTLCRFLAMALWDGRLFWKPSANIKRELAAARKQYWDLEHPPNGLKHHFHTLKNGTKIHYVTAASTNPSPSNLVIFMHGFPDSWALWKYHLSSSKLARDATLLAFDLPGYGGSDDLPSFDATNVLEAVTQFILEMKARYMSDNPAKTGKTIIVAHDWGTIIASRLASEAPQLADHFVLTAAAIPALWLANMKTRWSTSSRMLQSWTRNPRSYKLLQKAVVTLYPLISQLQKSSYVFSFNLLQPVTSTFGSIGGATWFYAMTHGLAHDPTSKTKLDPESKEAAELMAATVGPSANECAGESTTRSAVNGRSSKNADEEILAYPAAVRHRTGDGGWSTKLRLYREGLIWGVWTKDVNTLWQLSLEDQARPLSMRRRSSAGAALFETGPEGSLKVPATILWGAHDPAFETKVALDGVQDYLARGSQVLMLKEAGHWMPVETRARVIIEQVVNWVLEGEKTNLESVVGGDESYPVRLIAEREDKGRSSMLNMQHLNVE